MTGPAIGSISPFFIPADVPAAISFYRDKLGFEVTFQEPAADPFFAIVARDGAMILLKSVGFAPLPNSAREPRISMSPIRMRWRRSSRRAVSPSPCRSRTRTTVSGASSSGTPTATSCSSAVRGPELPRAALACGLPCSSVTSPLERSLLYASLP